MVVPTNMDDASRLVEAFQALSFASTSQTNSGEASGRRSDEPAAMTDLLLNTQILLCQCSADAVQHAFTSNVCERFCYLMSHLVQGEHYDLGREIMRRCFADLPPQLLFQNYVTAFSTCLNDASASAEFKEFLLSEISKMMARADLKTIQESKDANGHSILTTIVSRLRFSELGVIQEVNRCLTALCQRQPNGVGVFFSDSAAVGQLRSMLTESEIIRFRVYELTAAISIISPDALRFCVENGFIGEMLKEIDSPDILCSLNAMEILTEMAGPKTGADHCLRYFRDHGILAKLNDMLLSSQEAPDASFIFPAVMKFFGHLSRLYPAECCGDGTRFLPCVFDLVLNFNRLDVGQRLLAFDTLGLIGSTADGKMVLAQHDGAMEKCMQCFGNSFKFGPEELRVRHIEALGALLDLPVEVQTVELLALTEKWFKNLDRDPCQLIFDLYKQPFPAIHCAAGEIFKKLAIQPWAQQLMARQAGFLEYLLNRATEFTTEGGYLKYEIVQRLGSSPTTDEAFEARDVLRLKEYVTEGPFYVKVQPASVALEEA